MPVVEPSGDYLRDQAERLEFLCLCVRQLFAGAAPEAVAKAQEGRDLALETLREALTTPPEPGEDAMPLARISAVADEFREMLP